MKARRLVLIGNYAADGQESMLRFADLLANGLRERGVGVEIISPERKFAGRAANTQGGFSKWLGYLDKWLVFPATLRRMVKRKQQEFGDSVRFHVCDHSNAPYLAHLPADQTGITCHDVLAIRGALGYPETYCPASRTGVILQKWILGNLREARRIACVSHLTMRHLCEVAEVKAPQPGWTVVHNALNANFKKIGESEAVRILEAAGHRLPKRFLLHVGSNALRKNRRMLLQMIKLAGDKWAGDVCFAGEPVDGPLEAEARELGILSRVHTVPKPDHQALCALYSLAHAFVFPSFSEGFGWPVSEAQACGAPVIASNIEPLPEVSGGAAMHADPRDAKSFVAALLALDRERDYLIDRGLKNAARFQLPAMMDGYLELHDWAEPQGLQRPEPMIVKALAE